MKKIAIFSILIFLSISTFSQQTDSIKPLTKQDYLRKSKNQKTAAWVMLGALPVLAGTGLLIGNREQSTFDDAATGVVVAGIGVLSAIGSIPLFIASARNKRKAMRTSAYFKIETRPGFHQAAKKFQTFPALSMKVSF